MGRSSKVPLRAAWTPAALLLAAVAVPSTAAAQHGTTGEWLTYGGDPGHTRYSSLDQINPSNVADLEIVWRFTARNYGPNPFAQSEATPLYVDGVLYATLGQRRDVVAIDPGTGETLWMWRNFESPERLGDAPRLNSGRGVSYWTDGQGNDRILTVTPGYHLVALDAHTG
ncbi:MAG TPA: hypothetical protein VFQ22_04390, partial [Longimicrobiales bacterium]|nr:hypothetical protein [Longimicrobiales bacterium]